jgi:hypothetical protein
LPASERNLPEPKSTVERTVMTSEKVVEQIEKLIDEKLKLATILTSKSLGTNKEFFLTESRKKIEQVKASLLDALKNS